ncbi:hypothetical protein ACQR1Y_11880 [Bradyrhizobium sp. HKCCYLRH3099]|uniref:hypothetical protein n=1 Tax=unclassified Bradyrhizobium TaxID=2631580 RepID=UPI003EB8C0B4
MTVTELKVTFSYGEYRGESPIRGIVNLDGPINFAGATGHCVEMHQACAGHDVGQQNVTRLRT